MSLHYQPPKINDETALHCSNNVARFNLKNILLLLPFHKLNSIFVKFYNSITIQQTFPPCLGKNTSHLLLVEN
jgi:hypothetical protein